MEEYAARESWERQTSISSCDWRKIERARSYGSATFVTCEGPARCVSQVAVYLRVPPTFLSAPVLASSRTALLAVLGLILPRTAASFGERARCSLL